MTDSIYKYINLEYMDLMADGDVDMKKVMLQMLFDELPEEIGKVVSLAASGDMKTLSAVSHKLKSTLAFVGYADMDMTNKKIEKISNGEEDAGLLPELAGSMQRYCGEVMSELQSEFDKL